MDFSQVLIGWVVVSVPVSLLIGAFVSLGSKAQRQIPVRVSRTFDRAA